MNIALVLFLLLPRKSSLFWPFFAVGNGFSVLLLYLGSASQPGWPAYEEGEAYFILSQRP